MIQALRRGGKRITFFPMLHRAGHEDFIISLRTQGVEVFLGTRDGQELCLEELLARRAEKYAVVLISRPEIMGAVHRMVRKYQPQAKLVYDAEAVVAMRDIRYYELIHGKPMASIVQKCVLSSEISLARAADAVLTVSETERRFFHSHGVRHLDIAGHAMVPRPTSNKFTQRNGLLFVGAIRSFPSPNEDSLLYFCQHVLPRIRENADITVYVAGRNCSARVAQLAASGVELLGMLDDLTEVYERCRVFIAPTRFAAGIPYKVHEAASRGLPCVVSPLLAEQLRWCDGRECLVGSTATSFAEACLSLHADERLWRRIRRSALHAVGCDCSPAAFENGLLNAIGIDDRETHRRA